MPELISKYPEITLQILNEAGARCGEGVEQKILTKCPPSQFCALPTGEVCVYGLDGIPQMTQITPGEIARAAAGQQGRPWQESLTLSAPSLIVLGAVFLAGIVAGRMWGGRREGERQVGAGKS